MKLTLNKQSFVDDVLTPVSKVSDNLFLEFDRTGSNTFAKTIVNSADNSLILLAKVECRVDSDNKCIIPECKTFLRLFSGISQSMIDMHIETNSITYKDPTFSFKYHLLDESYAVNKKSISEEKINALEFDTHFVLTKQKLSEIIKFNSIIPEAEKLYFVTENNKIFAKIGDEQRSNTNEVIAEVSDSFTGEAFKDSFPINIQNVLLFGFNSDKIDVSVNHKLKIFKFETPCLKYIVSGLVR